MPRFVLEVGTEEIPPRFFPLALPQLRKDGAKMLERARLAPGELKVYGTPRRLVLIAENLAAEQAASIREERGPAARVAFDENGNPTKAGLGFARRHKIAAEDLVVKDTDQGKYVFATVHDPELPAKDALAPLLPELISGLSFPKSMRWGTGKLRFGRPIRWLLALVDDDVIEFELEGLHSGRQARGHPVLADEMFPIAAASDYERALEERFVLVDMVARRERIEESLKQISDQQHAMALGRGLGVWMPIHVLMLDREQFAHEIATNLALQTTFLVEWPTAASGQFDPEYLRLPRPVLIEEMQHVQSYFPLEDAQGDLIPRFIAVRDGGTEHLDTVLKGWQSVLRAKLIDADFFYQEDLKRPLSDRVEDLHGVVFGDKIGTVYEKVQRIRRIAAAAADQMPAGDAADPEALDRAAVLCKADLTTQMVTELPNLQGVMGGIYAGEREQEEPHPVPRAISEHYWPRFARDEIPGTTTGEVLAVADKLDTLCAHFAVGEVPSGSADPYGLRREATGIVRTITEARLHLRVLPLIEVALRTLQEQGYGERPHDEVKHDALDFLRQRLATLLRESDVRHDLIEAALAVGVDDVSVAKDRAEALDRLHWSSHFLPTVIASTRPINIAKDFEGGDVDPDLFEEEAERELWHAYQDVAAEAENVSLVELFDLVALNLRGPIDRYFTDVLVMAEDEALRRNRLALCWQLTQLFRRLADFSLIVQA